MRFAFGVISSIAILIIFYAMLDLFFRLSAREVDFLYSISLMVFAVSLVIVSGMLAAVSDLRSIRDYLQKKQ